MTKQPNGNITKYIRTKSKECVDNNRTLVTLAHDGSVSFIHMRPMAAVLLYPDQVREIIKLAEDSDFLKILSENSMRDGEK